MSFACLAPGAGWLKRRRMRKSRRLTALSVAVRQSRHLALCSPPLPTPRLAPGPTCSIPPGPSHLQTAADSPFPGRVILVYEITALGHCWDVLERVPAFANTSHSKFTVPGGHASDCFMFQKIDLSDIQINTLFIDVQRQPVAYTS